MKQNYSIQEAADALGVTYRAIQKWMKKGWIKFRRYGMGRGRVVISAEEIRRVREKRSPSQEST